jgi:hypothetical protein
MPAKLDNEIKRINLIAPAAWVKEEGRRLAAAGA